MINKDLLMEFFKDDDIKVVDKDFYIKSQMKSDVIKYITNLEQENEHLRTQVNIYENPDDYTLFYMWLNAKAKDKMKQLQEENERLKEKENKLQEKFKDWKKEIEKERKHYLCDRTDCCGRIKDSKKYRSLYQENERLNNIIDELEKWLDKKEKLTFNSWNKGIHEVQRKVQELKGGK